MRSLGRWVANFVARLGSYAAKTLCSLSHMTAVEGLLFDKLAVRVSAPAVRDTPRLDALYFQLLRQVSILPMRHLASWRIVHYLKSCKVLIPSIMHCLHTVHIYVSP